MFQCDVHIEKAVLEKLIWILDFSRKAYVDEGDVCAFISKNDVLLLLDGPSLFSFADRKSRRRVTVDDLYTACDCRLPRPVEKSKLAISWVFLVSVAFDGAFNDQVALTRRELQLFSETKTCTFRNRDPGFLLEKSLCKRDAQKKRLPSRESELLKPKIVRRPSLSDPNSFEAAGTHPNVPDRQYRRDAVAVQEVQPPRTAPRKGIEADAKMTLLNSTLKNDSAVVNADNSVLSVCTADASGNQLSESFTSAQNISMNESSFARPKIIESSADRPVLVSFESRSMFQSFLPHPKTPVLRRPLHAPKNPLPPVAPLFVGQSPAKEGQEQQHQQEDDDAARSDFITKFKVPTLIESKIEASLHQTLAREPQSTTSDPIADAEKTIPFVTTFHLPSALDLKMWATQNSVHKSAAADVVDEGTNEVSNNAASHGSSVLQPQMVLNFRPTSKYVSFSTSEPFVQPPEPFPERVLDAVLHRKEITMGLAEAEPLFDTNCRRLRPSDKLASLGHQIDFFASAD
eukprot:ANDGO_00913.mRNA.1 hypothetical protein